MHIPLDLLGFRGSLRPLWTGLITPAASSLAMTKSRSSTLKAKCRNPVASGYEGRIAGAGNENISSCDAPIRKSAFHDCCFSRSRVLQVL